MIMMMMIVMMKLIGLLGHRLAKVVLNFSSLIP